MGGKAEQPSPPPVTPIVDQGQQQSVNEEMLAQMMQMMAAQSAAAMMPPTMPELPQVYTAPEIDWSDKISQLNQKATGLSAGDRARKKGRLDTVLTSSLLDDTEASTTDESSLLAS